MAENKDKRISIRLSKKQDKIIRKRANEMGFSLSEYMLKNLFCKGMIVNNRIVLQAINRLQSGDNKLENNINQITKKLNANLSLNEIEISELKNLISETAIQRATLAKNVQEVFRLLSL